MHYVYVYACVCVCVQRLSKMIVVVVVVRGVIAVCSDAQMWAVLRQNTDIARKCCNISIICLCVYTCTRGMCVDVVCVCV